MTQLMAATIFHPLSYYSICDQMGSENQRAAREFQEHIALPSFFKSGNESSEKARNFPEVTQLVNSELGFHSACCLFA